MYSVLYDLIIPKQEAEGFLVYPKEPVPEFHSARKTVVMS